MIVTKNKYMILKERVLHHVACKKRSTEGELGEYLNDFLRPKTKEHIPLLLQERINPRILVDMELIKMIEEKWNNETS